MGQQLLPRQCDAPPLDKGSSPFWPIRQPRKAGTMGYPGG